MAAGADSVLGVCLLLAAAADGPPRFVPQQQFTLAWTHSIERQRWEEDYTVQRGPAGQPRLLATAARVRGSAAGMEPPPDAVLHDGWYHYRPAERLPSELRLTRSEFTPDYSWCSGPAPAPCRPLSDWLPSDGGVTVLRACLAPAAQSR